MEKRGSLGKWMMRNTSSIQVNYDIIDQRDLEEVMFIADCIHPISAYLFAHSPFHLGKSVGRKKTFVTIFGKIPIIQDVDLFLTMVFTIMIIF